MCENPGRNPGSAATISGATAWVRRRRDGARRLPVLDHLGVSDPLDADTDPTRWSGPWCCSAMTVQERQHGVCACAEAIGATA